MSLVFCLDLCYVGYTADNLHQLTKLRVGLPVQGAAANKLSCINNGKSGKVETGEKTAVVNSFLELPTRPLVPTHAV